MGSLGASRAVAESVSREVILVRDQLEREGYAVTSNAEVAEMYRANQNPNATFEVTQLQPYGDYTITNGNARKISASQVSVNGAENYEWTHGHAPRGRGSWAFLKTKNADAGNRNDVIWVNGTFAEAKKQARKEAARRGWASIYIGT